MDRLIFHNPNTQIGLIDLATSQVNKQLLFQFSQAVSPQSKIVILDNTRLVREYVVGNGLTLSNGSQDVSFILNGSNFSNYTNKTLTVLCTFFNIGDVEMQFNLKIVNSKL